MVTVSTVTLTTTELTFKLWKALKKDGLTGRLAAV